MPAIGVHHTPTTDRPWDGPAAKAAAPNDAAVLRHMAAWYAGANPTAKASYKEFHHGPSGSAPANLAACRAVLANLNGARSAPNIPTGDFAAIRAHVQAHLRDGGGTPAQD